MAGEKFIKHDGSGGFEEEESVQAGGASNADKLASLDSNGRWPDSMMPSGVGADTGVVQASEALSAGDFVNIHADGSNFRVRKADATSAGKEADGFVISSAASGANADVHFEGTNTAVTGAAAGPVYLSTTAGGFTSTAPSGTGNVVQRLGKAYSATSIAFEANSGIALA